jgi:hypothetical protein
MTLKDTALTYIAAGLNVVPATAKKVPIYGFDERGNYKSKPPGFLEPENHIYFAAYPMISIVCGEISGNLEVLDFDVKWLASCYDDFMTELVNTFPEIVEKLVIESTPSGGYHIYYRCAGIGGCHKLAGRWIDGEKKYFIESKGKGGLITCAPSPNYALVQGDLTQIQTISVAERNRLFAIARDQTQIEIVKEYPTFGTGARVGDSVFANYNKNGKDHALKLLLDAGFTLVKTEGDKVFLRHPESRNKEVNAIYGGKKGGLYVWGNSTTVDAEKNYSPCDIFIKFVAQGDKKLAYNMLIANGF